jgi:hypothetical protein
VWKLNGCRIGQRIDTDLGSLKQSLTVRFTSDERNQFIMFIKHSMNNNATLVQLAECSIHLIINTTAHHSWFSFIKGQVLQMVKLVQIEVE